MCVAADSNVLIKMQQDRLEADPPEDGVIAATILKNTYLALDIDGHCLQEACDCIQGPFSDELSAWAIQLENDGKLRRLKVDLNKPLEKKLREAGLPKKDMKWAKLSAHHCVSFLLTEDIDFYHPADKFAKTARKEKRKNDRTGDVLRIIKNDAGADVISIRHVEDIFE